MPVEQAADVRVIRDGETVELSVVIAELPGEDELSRVASSRLPSDGYNPLQLAVKEVSDELKQELEVDHGILVQEVINDGPADKAGVLPGDVILMVHRQPMNTPADFDRVMQNLGDEKSIAVLVQRPGGPLFLALTIEE